MRSSTLSKTKLNSHSLKRDRGNTSPRQKLNLLSPEPSGLKQSSKSTFTTEALLAQAITTAEVDYVLAYFSGRVGLIERSEFDPIAERAVARFTNRRGAA